MLWTNGTLYIRFAFVVLSVDHFH